MKVTLTVRVEKQVRDTLVKLSKVAKLSQGRIVETALERALPLWQKDAGDILRARKVAK